MIWYDVLAARAYQVNAVLFTHHRYWGDARLPVQRLPYSQADECSPQLLGLMAGYAVLMLAGLRPPGPPPPEPPSRVAGGRDPAADGCT